MATITWRTRKDRMVVGTVRYWDNAQQKQVTAGTVLGRTEALDYKVDVERAVRDGAPIPQPPQQRVVAAPGPAMRLDDFFHGPFRARCWAPYAAGTKAKYSSAWDVHVCHDTYGIADKTLAELDSDPGLIRAMVASMETAGKSNATINNTLGLLGAIFTEASTMPGTGMSRHPMRGGLVKYKSTQPDEPPLPHPPRAVALIARELPTDEDRLYLMLQHGCGLRPQEARALLPKHVREHTLFVSDAIGSDGKRKTTKSDKWHYPPVPDWLRAWLMEHATPAGFFPSLAGENGHRDWTADVFNPAKLSVAGEHAAEWPQLADATPYDLGRHSFATLHLAGGMWDAEQRRRLADWLGHTVRALEEHYASVIADYEGRPVTVVPADELRAAYELLRASDA